MEETLRKTLENYFSDLKEDSLLVLILFTIIIALIQIIQAIIVSRKIESFKAQLKKSEIKFSRYNQLQINALRSVYHKLVSMQLSSIYLFQNDSKTISHTELKEGLSRWIQRYIEFAYEFEKEKILMTADIIHCFKDVVSNFEQVKRILRKEHSNLEYHEEVCENNWQNMYDLRDGELKEIGEKVKKIRSENSVASAISNLHQLRMKVETEFSKMN